MRELLTAAAFLACSSRGGLPTNVQPNCPHAGPPVTIIADGERFYGTAQILASQDISGSGVLDLTVCGTSGGDGWQLGVSALSAVPADGGAPPPLPLSTSDEIDLPGPAASVSALIFGNTMESSAVAGNIVAAAKQIQGTITFGDGGTATFEGGFVFGCSTNEADPDFLTTFCKQFEPLAPP